MILLINSRGERASFSDRDKLYVLDCNVPLLRPATEIAPRDLVVGLGRIVTVARFEDAEPVVLQ